MTWSDNELIDSFRKAANQREQVKILAELNGVSIRDMAQYLTQLGCALPELPPGWMKGPTQTVKKSEFDPERARALFAEGLSDQQAAELLGISVSRFASWRRSAGLKRITGHPSHQKQPTPEAAGSGSPPVVAQAALLRACELGRMLVALAEAFPGMTVTVNGEAIHTIRTEIRTGMNGDGCIPRLDLGVGTC